MDRIWAGDRWHVDGVVAFTAAGLRPAAPGEADDAVVPRLRGTLLPPLTDAHVHVGLSDLREHPSHTLGRVLDLGGDPGAIASLAGVARETRSATEIRFAGAFLTAPGGYPSDRSWAPTAAFRFVATPDEAAPAVVAQGAAGATVIKVTLNSDAGPVPDDATLEAVVHAARARSMPVVAHVEGSGQAARAWRCGVDVLAHTPWSERLTGDLIRRMATRMIWISTLDMHGRGRYGDDFETARENLARFVTVGGTVVYGTDLGNELSSAEVQSRELAALRAAGLGDTALLRAVTGGGLLPVWSTTSTLLPDGVGDAADAIAALPSASAVHASRLEEHLT